MIRIATLAVLGLALPVFAQSEKESKREPVVLDSLLFEGNPWERTLEELKDAGPEVSAEEAKLREKLQQGGIELGRQASHGFDWLSGAKNGVRADPKVCSLFGQELGEVVFRGADGIFNDGSVWIYNRGDDGEISTSEFERRMAEWKALLDTKLAVRATTRDARGAVQTQGWMWRKDHTAVLLEGSVNRSEKRAEFIRLRLAPLGAARDSAGSGIARRGTLSANVTKDEEGYTLIDTIPMVDQGQKGYCVVATVERVARYFGANVDQHELAQIANTDEGGTSGSDMEKAFQRVTGKIHVRTLKHIEYNERQLERDISGYNRAARKAGVRTYDYDPRDYNIDPRHFWSRAHKETFRDMKAEQGMAAHFNRKIKEYVDQGIPLCWTLYLGMFPEKGLPQSFGGHMRLIIGYNFDGEVPMICYTDSWGAGHEKKVMRADEAWCMTMALYSMVPNR